jgi:hypothetical protein
MVLPGWAFDIAVLKSVFPGLVTMKANIAVGLTLGGTALVLLSRKQIDPPIRFCIAALAGMTIVLGGLTLGQYFFGWNLHIDKLLFRDVPSSVGTSQPGRMSPAAAFGFILVGTSMAVASQPISPRLRTPILTALGATLFAIGVVARRSSI